MYKTKIGIAGMIVSIIILAVLYFVPTEELAGNSSHSTESPPPIVVLNNYHDYFEINPVRCSSDSNFVNLDFNITNNLDDDYRLEIHLVQNDDSNQNLAKQAVLIQAKARQTTLEEHKMQLEPGMNQCAIEVKRFEKIG